MDFVSRIHNCLTTLRPAEQKVAQYVLDNLSFAAGASISELAAKVQVSQPSASRYVMLAAIDMLASEVAIRNQRKSREKLRRLKLHLDQHRQSSERLPLGD